MIEIKENTMGVMASNSARMLKIESIVKAWAKIDNDDSMSENQKILVAKAAMSQIWRIVEGGGE